jgi:hypothetical protein
MPNSTTETNSMTHTDLLATSSTVPNELPPADTMTGIIQELHRIRAEVQKGIAVLYDTECKVADCENAYERELQLSFINAQGTVADRQAISRLQASEKRLQADLAKAEWNRVKAKLKALETAQMGIQTSARLMETELKTLR